MAGTEPTVETIKISLLTIDPIYQRPLERGRVEGMGAAWDPTIVGILEVSRRANGVQAVFDGQHRLRAAEIAGVTELLCLVHTGLTVRDEAALFLRLQRERRTATPWARWHASLAAGDQAVHAINETVRNQGFEIGQVTAPLVITAIAAVEQIYNRAGIEGLQRVLAFVRTLWANDSFRVNGHMLLGLDLFFERYPNASRSELQRALSETPPKYLAREAELWKADKGGNKANAMFHVIENTWKPQRRKRAA